MMNAWTKTGANTLSEDINEQKAAPPGAVKYDAGKSPIFKGCLAYFPRAMEGIATISSFGATKYAWNGWLHVPDGVDRYTNALVRHLTAEGKGQILDEESRLPHHLHALWNAAARSELILIASEK